MTDTTFRIERLAKSHNRADFQSGSEPLDHYFRNQVTQDTRRNFAICFVAIAENSRIAAYYTLSAGSVSLMDLPESIGKKLPRYPYVPVVRLGRLAVDKKFQGQGLGGAMLADALIRVRKSDIAAYALVADAKNDEAKAFYMH